MTPTPPLTVRQKIMKLLYENPFGLTKQQLVDAINSTPNTVAQEVAYLGRANYVAETKGNYYKTPTGEASYEQDPMLSGLKNGKPEAQSSESPFPIDWDYVRRNPLCNTVLISGEIRGFPHDKIDVKWLIPVVLYYLQGVGYTQLPEGVDTDTLEPEEEFHQKALEKYLSMLDNRSVDK
jgi:hypothetical protein